MTSDHITPGDVWLPKPNTVPGLGMVRILGRYPGPVEDGEVLWLIEHVDYIQRIERVPEETLLATWHLIDDVDPQPKEHHA